jgi:uncharacterized protein (TIRG00374 family)
MNSFTYGLSPLRRWHRLPILFVLSGLGWTAQFLLFYVLMLAFAIPRAPILTVLAGTVGNFATLIPASPASVGTFDGAVVKVLMDSGGIPAGTATAYALVVHGALFVPVILAGIAVMWRSQLKIGQVLAWQ